MKIIASIVIVVLCLSANISAQSEALIYLKNGSQIRAQVNVDNERDITILSLADGKVLEFQNSQIKHIDHRPNDYLIIESGRRIISKGTYKTFAINYMIGNHAVDNSEGKRTGFGAQFSMGHHFIPELSIGAGINADWHEQFFLPIYGEVGGLITNRVFSTTKKEKKQIRIPLTYNIQIGHNFQAEEWISDPIEFEDLKGGWMVYPSIGIVFPSRDGNVIRADFGYKFQRFTRTYKYDWREDYFQKDIVTLKSLTLRVGWIF